MKKLSILLSVFVVTILCFQTLLNISDTNQYTSVRQYTKPKAKTEVIPVKTEVIPEKSQETAVPVVNTPSLEVPLIPPSSKGTDTTPPVIEFLNYKDGDVVTLSIINVLVKVTDDWSASEKINIDWAGRQRLIKGFNPIVVTATDEAGNVGSAYIVIEQK